MRLDRKGILRIAGGTGVGQLLVLLAFPVLTRLYSPAEFGIFAICSSLVAVIATVATLRLELAIPIPKNNSAALTLGRIACLSALAVSTISLVLIGVLGDDFGYAIGIPQLMPWILLIPFCALMSAVGLVLSQFAVRRHAYGNIGMRNAVYQASTVLAQITFGILGLGIGGLVLGLAAGNLFAAATLWWTARRDVASDSARGQASAGATLRAYWKYPALLAPAGLLNAAATQLPVVLLGGLYGGSVAGWFGLAQRVLAVPVGLIATAIGQVYLGTFADAGRSGNGNRLPIFRRTTAELLAVGVGTASLAVLFGPTVFAGLFGEVWRTSGEYAQALGLALLGQVVAVPVSQTLAASGRVGTQFTWDSIRVLAIVGTVLGIHSSGGSDLRTVWAISIIQLVSYAALWLLSYRAASRFDEVRLTGT